MDSYRIIDIVGKGSFGDIYRGVDKRDGTEIAIKVAKLKKLKTTACKKAQHLSFKTATARAADASPPASVPTARTLELQCFQACSVLDGVPSLIFKFDRPNYSVIGMNKCDARLSMLAKLVKDPLDRERIASRVAKSLFATLRGIHELGYVHMDIKPDNIMFNFEDLAKYYVIDFGLSKRIGATTAPNVICGTVRYMSPNRHRNEPYSKYEDFDALAYSLYDFIRKVPWCRPVTGLDKNEMRAHVCKMKESFKFSGGPPELKAFARAIHAAHKGTPLNYPDLDRLLDAWVARTKRLPVSSPLLSIQKIPKALTESSLKTLNQQEALVFCLAPYHTLFLLEGIITGTTSGTHRASVIATLEKSLLCGKINLLLEKTLGLRVLGGSSPAILVRDLESMYHAKHWTGQYTAIISEDTYHVLYNCISMARMCHILMGRHMHRPGGPKLVAQYTKIMVLLYCLVNSDFGHDVRRLDFGTMDVFINPSSLVKI